MKKTIIISLACVLIPVAFARNCYLTSYYSRHLISETINVPLVFRGDAGDLDISQWKGEYVVLYFLDLISDKESKESHKKFRKICDSRIKNDERVKNELYRSATIGFMNLFDNREEEMNVPAPESRTDVKPFNKMQPRQGNLWKNETPKELLPP
ncbi:MAG: hypothetical protein LBL42_02990 [Tannerella sp.]|jgi:hypothetical protein|nr:hypothetical protein [Tannerella sp.]